MDLRRMIDTHNERKPGPGLKGIYHRNNPGRGRCVSCDNKLYSRGLNRVKCEYHWLKGKYDHFLGKCRRANDRKIKPPVYPSLKGIRCKFSWVQFIEWCIDNPQYKRMKLPALIRINRKGHYSEGNIKWKETYFVSKK
jgi:hypothetical protein